MNSVSTHKSNERLSFIPTTLIISNKNKLSEFEILFNLLQSLLILDVILLDKLNNRSNHSLILIHLKNSLDKLIDTLNSDSNIKPLILNFIKKFNNSINLIFENSIFYNLTELKNIYQAFYKNYSNSTLLNLNNDFFIDFLNNILCCSDSLSDFIHFNGIFNNENLIIYNNEKLKFYYLNNSFNKNKINSNIENSVNNENLIIVQSPEFRNFHLKRWESLNLLDRHIFKN